jgi:hypothetical protein
MFFTENNWLDPLFFCKPPTQLNPDYLYNKGNR